MLLLSAASTAVLRNGVDRGSRLLTAVPGTAPDSSAVPGYCADGGAGRTRTAVSDHRAMTSP